MQNKQPLKIFIAFANEDRNVRDKLLAQMNLLKAREHWEIWASHEIKAGATWNEEIKARLNDSEVVVLLMSSNFFNSNYILEVELPAIVEKHRNGNCQIIPVLAKKCLWKDTPFGDYIDLGKIQALPSGERPIVSKGAWDSDDDPYVETVIGIKESVRTFRIKKAEQDSLQLLEIQKNQKEEQKLEKQKVIDEQRKFRQAEKIQLESVSHFHKIENQDKAKVSTRSLGSGKYYYLGGAGVVILMAMLLWLRFQVTSDKATKTDGFVSQGNLLTKQGGIDSQFIKTPIQDNKVPTNSSIIKPDSQSVKSQPANKILQESKRTTIPAVEKPKSSETKKEISTVKGPGTGRWAVRSGTYAYIDGAKRRLEEVIKAGFPNAEISMTKEGKSAVIVFRSNDKDAAIRIADKLTEKGMDAAVFDRLINQ